MKEIIEKKIKENIKITSLEVVNNSHLHKSHFAKKNMESSEDTHFLIILSSPDFNKISKIEAHRKINNLLSEEFKKGLHALEIKIKNNI
jgi:BolA protein